MGRHAALPGPAPEPRPGPAPDAPPQAGDGARRHDDADPVLPGLPRPGELLGWGLFATVLGTALTELTGPGGGPGWARSGLVAGLGLGATALLTALARADGPDPAATPPQAPGDPGRPPSSTLLPSADRGPGAAA